MKKKLTVTFADCCVYAVFARIIVVGVKFFWWDADKPIRIFRTHYFDRRVWLVPTLTNVYYAFTFA